MPNVIETITKLQYLCLPKGVMYNIRCWREEYCIFSDTNTKTRKEIVLAISRCEEDRLVEPIEIAERLLSMDRMNAVEVLTPTDDGVVIYKDWP